MSFSTIKLHISSLRTYIVLHLLLEQMTLWFTEKFYPEMSFKVNVTFPFITFIFRLAIQWTLLERKHNKQAEKDLNLFRI